jgi:hypothetical protein
MSHKKHGQLTTSPEWARHLRPLLRRFFWKGERRAERSVIREESPGNAGAVTEFLIRRTDGEWFDLHRDQFATVFHLEARRTRVVEGPGDHCVAIEETRVSISYEDPGLHLVFEGSLSTSQAAAIAEEFRARVCEATGQAGTVVPI